MYRWLTLLVQPPGNSLWARAQWGYVILRNVARRPNQVCLGARDGVFKPGRPQDLLKFATNSSFPILSWSFARDLLAIFSQFVLKNPPKAPSWPVPPVMSPPSRLYTCQLSTSWTAAELDAYEVACGIYGSVSNEQWVYLCSLFQYFQATQKQPSFWSSNFLSLFFFLLLCGNYDNRHPVLNENLALLETFPELDWICWRSGMVCCR